MAEPNRRGGRKGPRVGTGGHGRKALEGRGPTPKAEDREYHPAHRRKMLADRAATKRPERAERPAAARRRPGADELVTGRNAVLEALRARVPALTLYVAARIEFDDRIRETMSIAAHREIPVLEVMRPELDRLTGGDLLHQGVALSVKAYEYAHPLDLVERAERAGEAPLIVALDGVTDPRNLGAVIRSAAAFGGHGVLLPQRRSAGVTAAAWRSSAGAVARLPVASAANLAQTLVLYREHGLFIVGLDGGGDTALPAFELADRPLVLVAGAEGAGLSRLVRERCDQILSIPIGAATESLNASVAVGVALYQVATTRASAE